MLQVITLKLGKHLNSEWLLKLTVQKALSISTVMSLNKNRVTVTLTLKKKNNLLISVPVICQLSTYPSRLVLICAKA